MSFNYGREKRKFDQEWERLSAEYAAAGMDEAAIMAMKQYDWQWFCSQRVYNDRAQPLPSECSQDENGKHTLFQKFDTLSTRLDCQSEHGSRRRPSPSAVPYIRKGPAATA